MSYRDGEYGPAIHVWCHANCPDGFCSAYVFSKFAEAVSNELGFPFPEVYYYPVAYGDSIYAVGDGEYGEPGPKVMTDDIVYILDFSFDRDDLIELSQRCGDLYVLDHHKSAQRKLDGLPFCTFDMTKCGARLTLEHLLATYVRPGDFTGGDLDALEKLVSYVEDRDLWKWELPHSKEVSACLRTVPYLFSEWDAFSCELTELFDGVVARGRSILSLQSMQVKEACKRAVDASIEVGGLRWSGVVVNNTNRDITSELGHELSSGNVAFACSWHRREDGRYVYELRSAEDGEDVSKLAEKFGGGGHPHAAGFDSDLFLFEEAYAK